MTGTPYSGAGGHPYMSGDSITLSHDMAADTPKSGSAQRQKRKIRSLIVDELFVNITEYPRNTSTFIRKVVGI
jgi:hypothetical protein